METRSINTWPFSGPENAIDQYNNNTGLWVETNKENYYQLLECLPPLWMNGGGFIVGEAYDYKEGQGTTYSVCIETANRFFIMIRPVRSFNYAACVHEIEKQFNL